MSTNADLSRLVDYAAEVTRQPVSAFPTLSLLSMLSETFEATVGWSWLEEDGAIGWHVLHAPAGWPPPGAVDVWLSHQFDHPLHRWFAQASRPDPMTLGRVPEAVADHRVVAFAREALGSPDMAQALTIPVAVSGRSHAAFVMSHGGRDFTGEQMLLAQQIQPLMMLLERQAGLSSRLEQDLVGRFGLTARESSVLYLLRQGETIQAMGHHLACSPRTVEKHLEHLYRKLDVRDRLHAVRVAEAHATATSERVDSRSRGAEEPRLTVDVNGITRSDLLAFEGRIKLPQPELVYPNQPPAS